MTEKKHLKPRTQMLVHPKEKHVDPDGSVSADRMDNDRNELGLCNINGRIFSANGVFRTNKDLDTIADYFVREYAPNIIADWENNKNKTFAIWRSTSNCENRRTIEMIVPPEILSQTQGMYSYLSDAITGLTYVRSTNTCRVLCEPIFAPNDETGAMDIEIRFITIYPTAETDTLEECIDKGCHYGAAQIAPEVYRQLNAYTGKPSQNDSSTWPQNPIQRQNKRRYNQIKMDLVNSEAMSNITAIDINDRFDRLNIIVDTPMGNQVDEDGKPLICRMNFPCRLDGNGTQKLMKPRMMYMVTGVNPYTLQAETKLAQRQPPDNPERAQQLINRWKQEHPLICQDLMVALMGPFKPTQPSTDAIRIARFGAIQAPSTDRTPCDTSHIKRPDTNRATYDYE